MVSTGSKAPHGLTKHAARWYEAVASEFRLRSSAELQTLHEAAKALDRADQCAAILKKSELFIPGQRGLVAHPALKAEVQARAQYLSACRSLGINRPEQGEKNG